MDLSDIPLFLEIRHHNEQSEFGISNMVRHRRIIRSEDYARPGEVFITNAVIRSDGEINTKDAFEAHMRKRFAGYDLRFQYEHIVRAGVSLSSEEFGYIHSDLPEGSAWGVAVYGILNVEPLSLNLVIY
ncbi:MAG: hypothetical protein R3A44_06090 [Caldilineaceae bacterium]